MRTMCCLTGQACSATRTKIPFFQLRMLKMTSVCPKECLHIEYHSRLRRYDFLCLEADLSPTLFRPPSTSNGLLSHTSTLYTLSSKPMYPYRSILALLAVQLVSAATQSALFGNSDVNVTVWISTDVESSVNCGWVSSTVEHLTPREGKGSLLFIRAGSELPQGEITLAAAEAIDTQVWFRQHIASGRANWKWTNSSNVQPGHHITWAYIFEDVDVGHWSAQAFQLGVFDVDCDYHHQA